MQEQKKLIDILEKIDKKLGFLIGEKVKEKSVVIKDQVALLSSITKDYNELAFILGISPSHAAKELSKQRKGVKK